MPGDVEILLPSQPSQPNSQLEPRGSKRRRPREERVGMNHGYVKSGFYGILRGLNGILWYLNGI